MEVTFRSDFLRGGERGLILKDLFSWWRTIFLKGTFGAHWIYMRRRFSYHNGHTI